MDEIRDWARKQGPKAGAGLLSKGTRPYYIHQPIRWLGFLCLERVVDEEGDGESVS